MDMQLETRSPHRKNIWTMEAILNLTTQYSELYKKIESIIEQPPKKSSIEGEMLQFEEQDGIGDLHELAPGLNVDETDGLGHLMQALSPYFTAGFLIESLGRENSSSWWTTGFFFKGQWFALEISDQVRLEKDIPHMSPLQVKTAPLDKFLKQSSLDFLPLSKEAHGFLFRPTHVSALMLVTEIPEPFARLKIETSLKLINRCFNR